MAKIDELLAQVNNDALRTKLIGAVADLRSRKRFGLVYEEHVPESVLLAADVGITKGSEVMLRKHPSDRTRYTVESFLMDQAKITDGTNSRTVLTSDLLVVKAFGEPVYPVLRQHGETVVRSDNRPFHAVVNGENFHALQLLLFAYESAIDCVYIDPPYNTGNRDWRYNNDYVDINDSYQHSKWLSMMEKRLRLARKLLAPDSVLIVTIDEHEVQNLGVLLRQMFKDAKMQMITIVMNSAGSTSPGLFSRAEEYAYFCFFGAAKVAAMSSDLLADSKPTTQFWFPLFRSRGLNDRPSKRANLVYPIAVDPKTLKIVGVGNSLKERVDAGEVSGDLDIWRPDPKEKLNGMPVVWPILDTGEVTTWQLNPLKLLALFNEGFVRVREPRNTGGQRPFTISYVKSGNQKKVRDGEVVISGRETNGAYVLQGGARTTIPKTTWKVASHDARTYGTTMLRDLLGANSFNYPKSPYAVADTLQTVLADKRDAVVLDFFAGSGTTLQALSLLNAADDGSRRCILVTNNEVDEKLVDLLAEEGYGPGDDPYEDRGIARAVTFPRVRATITGLRPDGTPVPDQYLDGTDVADGFKENAVFFALEYENPDLIEIGERFADVMPSLWLAAGAVGDPSFLKTSDHWFLTGGIPFAVLLDEDHFRSFAKALVKRSDVTHVWLVTDSEAAFGRMRASLSDELKVGMLYRDYLRSFRINVES